MPAQEAESGSGISVRCWLCFPLYSLPPSCISLSLPRWCKSLYATFATPLGRCTVSLISCSRSCKYHQAPPQVPLAVPVPLVEKHWCRLFAAGIPCIATSQTQHLAISSIFVNCVLDGKRSLSLVIPLHPFFNPHPPNPFLELLLWPLSLEAGNEGVAQGKLDEEVRRSALMTAVLSLGDEKG